MTHKILSNSKIILNVFTVWAGIEWLGLEEQADFHLTANDRLIHFMESLMTTRQHGSKCIVLAPT